MPETPPWWVRVNTCLLEVLVAVILLLVGLFKVIFPVLGAFGPLPAIVDKRTVDVDAPTAHGAGSGPVMLRTTGHAELVFHHPGLGDRLLLVLPGLADALLLSAVLYILLQIAGTFHEANFFAPPNSRRLLVIAGALLLIGTVPPALDLLTTHLLVQGTPVEHAVRMPYALGTAAVFGGMLTAAAAAAFHRGAALREDAEGLV
jgi:uncharacterized membrane protein